MTAPDPFPADALAVNRRGELSDQQRRGFGALASCRRRNGLTIAAFFTAGAGVVYFLASPATPAAIRNSLSGGALGIAAVLVLRSVSGSDALTRDLGESRVASVEGAIGKRMLSGRSGSFLLQAGDATFRIGAAAYRALPGAGWARVYYLPLSRQVVNVELLPCASAPIDATVDGVVRGLGAAVFAPNRRERNEARAAIAALGDALRVPIAGTAQPPPAAERDPRPLAEAIVGTWTNGVMRLSFSANGTVDAKLFGAEHTGRWSIDEAGRLHSDITGHDEAAEAWIGGERLTIVAGSRSLTFSRERGGA
jgi:hypothetical protein